MKSNKHSKKNIRHSEVERNDVDNKFSKAVKRDKSTKKRLSIYDEFDEEESFDDPDYEPDDDSDYEEEEY
ncbi:hypothetical protein [Gaoshiqia sp. Z1-71]|uniref:hypothetical protein n=1 Tax=Gaoshiqia hydrogeniformans TaxID=3290090 RepID=UPI003BF80332